MALAFTPPVVDSSELRSTLPDSVNTTSLPTSLALIMSVARAEPAANSMTTTGNEERGNFRFLESHG